MNISSHVLSFCHASCDSTDNRYFYNQYHHFILACLLKMTCSTDSFVATEGRID
ncbi:hypothetical protein SPWS13_0105 [Shewanella putrefaciens]|nr:hypothetical protein SPWS13_0105 [Shewanella putrefaciens]